MANTYSQIYLHLVFAVKYRNAAILKKWSPSLYSVIGNLINETGCKTFIVNGVEDHVHCLVGLKPAISVSELMKSVKAKSSKYINEERLTPTRFEWQTGYGAFSLHRSRIKQVYRYIQNQEEHHRKVAFKEEYTNILTDLGIKFDPQYTFQNLS